MNTPISNRKHIGFYGNRNAGKSSLMNAVVGQDIALVSDIRGTTTDPVSKAIELIPFGPVVFIDTAGIDDEGQLGNLRIEKTLKTLEKVDLGIYVLDSQNMDFEGYEKFIQEFKKRKTPYITVINKIDLLSDEDLEVIKHKYNDIQLVSTLIEDTVNQLKESIMKILESDQEETLIGDIVPYNGKIIMVVPIDSEAPKGRLILPQVQLLRDALDHGIKAYVVRDTELESSLEDLKDVDLVVTDSQIFKEVDKIVPENINLTSFSIIMARQKGDLNVFIDGVKAIDRLREKVNPKVLIMESCSHNTSHEDIGRVKIPKLLTKKVGKEIDFHFKMGEDFPNDLETFDLVIHCGSCMLNKKIMERRIDRCRESGVYITNYGMVIAYITGIIDRAVKVFIGK